MIAGSSHRCIGIVITPASESIPLLATISLSFHNNYSGGLQ
ncbi:13998_t:CDS:2 [Gigaspora margarita]|uniref:13998_t:CDS:1 n=1 Tax=Gigaspora margarita TaxID=4874 RepID=A0ABN7USZ1_GIGMA|nr:13998_t:CDS:2 [Gigaspora margarita]